MAFYYWSLFSVVPLAIAYGVLALAYWWIARTTRGSPRRVAIRAVAAIILLILPVSEELWIAWNFARACESAGTFIKKKVTVGGFYDDTRSTHAGEPTQQAAESFEKSGYRFFEMRGPKGGAVHIERFDGLWRSTLLEHPKAKYQFRNTDPPNGTPWGHKIGRSGSVVIDSDTNEEIARYASFGRESPWFYISLGVPPYACDAPGRWPNTRESALIYREVLIPAAKMR